MEEQTLYERTLREYLERFKAENPFNLHKCCVSVSFGLNTELGYFIVSGEYWGKFDNAYVERTNRMMEYLSGWRHLRCGGELVSMSHFWNFDPETRNHVDLTAYQFDASLPEILIIGEKDSRIAKGWHELKDQKTNPMNSLRLKSHAPTYMWQRASVQAPSNLIPEYMRN